MGKGPRNLHRLKLEIHGRTVPRHLKRVAPDGSSFQPIDSGGSFIEAPCEQHNRSLQSPRATMPTPPSAFKTGPPASFSRESFTPSSPFCGFRFCETGSLPLTHDRISVL
ncbi:hypothetical protein AVEN_190210-1 [Araneus ventricosus]|uniref:Uncharacterized protein n=1 Tax=Araneus ventricosus TaxID=182803 RepID=A0A4Y2FFH4_ARAVE|nr:hypothetical protein AVEN_190210-1 [Araneus ventricosus]